MDLPKLPDFDLKNKRVLVRVDLDVASLNDERVISLTPTLDYLVSQNAKITLIAHKGRPDGKPDTALSLAPFSSYFQKWGVTLLENLRFTKAEEDNNPDFAKNLSLNQDFFVNEAFGSSHRNHASIVTLPKLLPHAAGFRFIKEVENLTQVFNNPKKPVMVIISGVKDDKLSYLEKFLEFSDKILIAGRLPDYIHDASPLRKNPKVIIATLVADKEDITIHSMETFEQELLQAGTLVVSGPMGKFEDEGHRQGTQRILAAIANSQAFKIAGGGDTTDAINIFNLHDKFNWISVGGGAMLDFLANKTLPGIEALT